MVYKDGGVQISDIKILKVKLRLYGRTPLEERASIRSPRLLKEGVDEYQEHYSVIYSSSYHKLIDSSPDSNSCVLSHGFKATKNVCDISH